MFDINNLIAHPHNQIKLSDYSTQYVGTFTDKSDSGPVRKQNLERLTQLQDMLYAFDKHAVLLIFQAMDAAGKDGTIKHVMSGVNPQGCEVVSFQAPSTNELKHDFLWRTYRRLPERGKIGIFNRSYYEEVLVTKVMPQFILKQRIPGIRSLKDINQNFWEERYRSINEMERHLHQNGTVILKFFLHVSRKEQKKRFMDRILKADKHWKFDMSDIESRDNWDKFQNAYETMINHTSTNYAPWYIIPADHKWFMRTAVSQILVDKLEELDLHYPKVTKLQQENIEKAKQILSTEKK
ncbi:PPK2 family polyphosphate:nucleotide phosphotransferase [Catalinimonas alkaloidigena]|uniref:polyphosphate kinase 2 family protein n=1 Tax=Catalinimonas alkaloidigena TaxID=1075417 RepID=UPI0024051BA6|nr:polyphosphate kinase 2 family protein [Catalinimonas alkaloidigena]MDF9797549.1 PPK2 family polyphosphate:nucleotide phosphotransferase [Catalinimonas alkaloidigena]